MAVQGPKIEPVKPTLPVAMPGEVVSGEPRQAAPAPEPADPRPSQAARLSAEQMRDLQARIAQRLDEYLKDSGRSLEFRVDEGANATVITVRRADTGEVVRQYPSEEALSLLRRLNEQSGTLLDELA